MKQSKKNTPNIVLAGLVYDDNLGDQAIYTSTRKMVEKILSEEQIDCDIKIIDLYGRIEKNKWKSCKITSIIRRLFYKIKQIVFNYNLEEIIIKNVKSECKSVFNKNTKGLIFVGGGLLKYSHQIISKPMQTILNYANTRDIPTMLSAVGVEGFDDNSKSCIDLMHAVNEKNVKVITTRDDIELLTRKWITNDNIMTDKVADSACGLSHFLTPIPSIKNKNTVGLGIGRSQLFRDYEIDFAPEEMKRLWVEIYEKIIQKGYECVLFTNGLGGDQEFALEVLDEIHKKGYTDTICLEKPNNTQDLVNIIDSFIGVIALRLHASIIAFSYDVPSIGLVWNNKQLMFGESICHKERFIQKDEFDADTIVSALERAINDELIDMKEYKSTTEKWLKQFIDKFIKW